MNSQSSRPIIGKICDKSTSIKIFLMFEFLPIFSLSVWLNFAEGVTEAVSYSGDAFLFPFLACLLAAPLVFTHIIHLADNIFEAMKLRRNTWRKRITALFVALSIGAAISCFFLQEF
jgi:uncharacterized membrane protein